MQPRVVLVVLCGLPGAGKTTLCHALDRWQHLAPPPDAAPRPAVVHVEYDSVLPPIPSAGEGPWRAQRRQLLNRTVALLSACKRLQLGGGGGGGGNGDGDAAARADALDVHFAALQLPPAETRARVAAAQGVLVLVDDNMYYAGMRHEVFHASRKIDVPVVFVHVDADPDVSAARNAARFPEHIVPADVWRTMRERFEAPSTQRAWETSLVTVQLPSTGTDPPLDASSPLVGRFVADVLEAAMADVLRMSEWREAQAQRVQLVQEQELDRARVEGNLVHQLDLYLRRRMGELVKRIQDALPQLDAETKAVFVRLVMEERRLLLDTVRNSSKTILLNESFAEVAEWAMDKLAHFVDDRLRAVELGV